MQAGMASHFQAVGAVGKIGRLVWMLPGAVCDQQPAPVQGKPFPSFAVSVMMMMRCLEFRIKWNLSVRQTCFHSVCDLMMMHWVGD